MIKSILVKDQIFFIGHIFFFCTFSNMLMQYNFLLFLMNLCKVFFLLTFAFILRAGYLSASFCSFYLKLVWNFLAFHHEWLYFMNKLRWILSFFRESILKKDLIILQSLKYILLLTGFSWIFSYLSANEISLKGDLQMRIISCPII